MKKAYFFAVVIVVISMLLAACGAEQQPGRMILDPNSPEAQADIAAGGYGVISIDNRPTLQAQHDECLAKIDPQNPIETILPTNEAGSLAVQVWYCGGVDPVISGGMVLVSSANLTRLTPGRADDAVVHGIVFVRSVGYFALLMAASYMTGDVIAYTIENSTPWVNDLAPTIEGNVFLSTRHWESQQVIAGAYSTTESDGKTLKRKGDGHSNGSVRIYAGVNNGRVSIAILHIVGTQVNFMILSGDVKDAGFCTIPGNCTDLGGGQYIDTTQMVWGCAWTLSKVIGHEQHSQDQFLTVGEGWQYWATMQAKYALFTELAEIRLP